jgi:hypothetical protein
MHFAEGHEQPEFFGSIPHSIYWSIVTITSGYGNVEPVTKAGEVIALLTGFLGVCMAAIMTGIVASAFSNQLSRKKAAYQSQLRQVLADGIVSEAEARIPAHPADEIPADRCPGASCHGRGPRSAREGKRACQRHSTDTAAAATASHL